MAEHSHRIALAQAVELVARARQDPDLKVKGWQFSSPIIREILDHPETVGLRFYMARTEEDAPTLVVVGTNAEGADVISGTIAEWAWPCPPVCDESSPFFEP